MSGNIKGALLALLAFAIFSTHDVVVRLLGEDYSPVQTLFFTSLLSFPLLTLNLVGDSAERNLRPVHPWWIALRSLSMPLGGMCAFYAFTVLPLAQVYAVLFTIPLLITLMSIPVLGEKVGVHRLAAVFLGLAGVAVVLQPGEAELGLGHLAAAFAAFTSSLQSIIARKIGREERRIVLMLFPLIATFVIMACLLPFVYKPMPIEALGGMAIVAVFGFTAAMIMVAAYTSGEAAVVAPMQYSQIIWAAIFGALFFGETIAARTWVGASIIIASGLYIVAREALGGRSENTPVLRTRSRGVSPTAPRISEFLNQRK